MNKSFQFVWWGFGGMCFGLYRFDDPEETDLYWIYDWIMHLGPFDIRKWTNRKLNK